MTEKWVESGMWHTFHIPGLMGLGLDEPKKTGEGFGFV